MRISIVVPAYNEEQRIARTLQEYLEYFSAQEVDFIIVPNNCSDGTVAIAERFRDAQPERVSVHVISGYVGKGGAVVDGFRRAKGEYVGFVDADGSTPPEEFQKLIAGIGDFSGAIASRWKRGSKIVNANAVREIVSMGFIAIVKLLFWMPIVDTQCGAKLFTRSALGKVIDRLRIFDMAFDVELLWKLKKTGARTVEIPTVWVDNSGTSMTLGSPFKLLRNAWSMLTSILKLRFLSSYA